MLDFNFNPHLDRPEATPVPLFGEINADLEGNGYIPTPITPGTKRPPHDNWTDPAALTDDLVAQYRQAYTGLLCAETPGIDLDVPDPER